MVSRTTSLEWACRLGIFVLVVFVLSIAREVFIPLALSILLTFLLHPAVVRLHRLGIGRIPAVLIVSLMAIATSGLVLYHLGSEMASFAEQFPKYKSELTTKLRELGGTGSNLGGMLVSFREEVEEAVTAVENDRARAKELEKEAPTTDTISTDDTLKGRSKSLTGPSTQDSTADRKDDEARGNSVEKPVYVRTVNSDSTGNWMGWFLSASSLLAPIGTGGLVLVFTLFLLVYQGDLRDRFIKLVSAGQYVTTTHALNEAGQRITRYLVAQSIVNGTYGLVVAFGLWGIGLAMTEDGFPNYLLWGALCSILRFVPYAGPVIAGVFPIAIALAVFSGFQVFIAVLVLIILLELLSNNVFEPWLYGSTTGISAVAVIFASVFWGWLWGPVGLLLATPLTVCLVVLGKHVPPFRIFQTMLGEGETISFSLRLYQRLLAKDVHQATLIVKERLAEKNLNHVFDTMIVPTLRRMRNDRKHERLKVEDEKEMVDTIFKILDQSIVLKEGNSETPSRDFTVVAIPARLEVEQLLLQSGLKNVGNANYRLAFESHAKMPSQIVNKLKRQVPDIIVIGLLAPGGTTQAEFLGNQIRSSLPSSKIILHYMGRLRKFDQLFQRMRSAGVDYVATSFAQTAKYLEMFAGEDPDLIENKDSVLSNSE